MTDEYQIRRVRRDEEDKVAEAWRQAYTDLFPVEFLYPQKYRWIFTGNPFLIDPQGDFPIWVAVRGGRVAAWVCAEESDFELAGQLVRGAYGNLAFTLKEHRRQGLGQAVQGAMLGAYPIYMALGMTKANRRIYSRIEGGYVAKPIFTYLKLLRGFDADALWTTFVSMVTIKLGRRWGGFLRVVGNLGAKYIGAWKIGLLYKMGQRRKGRHPEQIDEDLAQEVERFGEEADKLWQACRKRYTYAVPRTSQYLNWRYVEQPHTKHRRFLFRDQAGEVTGLLVFRLSQPPELPVGVITELLLRDDDLELGRQMLAFAEAQMRQAGMTQIQCGVNTEFMRRVMETEGFRLFYVNVAMIFLSRELREHIPAEKILAGDWLMTLGDSDLDMVRRDNQPGFGFVMRVILGRPAGYGNLE